MGDGEGGDERLTIVVYWCKTGGSETTGGDEGLTNVVYRRDGSSDL